METDRVHLAYLERESISYQKKNNNNSRRPDFTTQNKLYHQEGVPKHYV
jgi:hypothetical protein